MRRGLWFAAGAGTAVYTMARARRVKQAFTREGLGDRWNALVLGARLLRDEVAQGRSEAETELRERFGLVPHGVPELASAEGRLVGSRSSAGAGRSGGSGAARTEEGDD